MTSSNVINCKVDFANRRVASRKRLRWRQPERCLPQVPWPFAMLSKTSF